jgi:histidinol dehydrogenase
VRSFLRSVHVVEYSREALGEVAGHVMTLADAEDLPGHGAAVRVRFPAS